METLSGLCAPEELPRATTEEIYNPAGNARSTDSRIAEKMIHANRRDYAPDGRVDL